VAWSNGVPYGATFGAGGAGAWTVTNAFAPLVSLLTFSNNYTLAGSGLLTISNGINASASAALASPVNLAGNQTWTVASNQTLTVSGPVSGSNSLVLAGGGTVLINGVTGNGNVSVSAGTTLGGAGNLGGTVDVFGSVSPGGVLSTTGSQYWYGGANYSFTLENATNSSDWSLLNVDGEINIQSTSANPFTINLVTPGPVPGFASGNAVNWTVATAGAGIQSFTPGSIVVNTAAFSNSFTGTFRVAPNASGNALLVQYTPSGSVSLQPVQSGQVPAFATLGQAGGQITFSFTGPNGQGYRLLGSADLSLPLSNWTVLASGVFGDALVNFTDSAASTQRFYQLVSP
jgi:hypothetical protein